MRKCLLFFSFLFLAGISWAGTVVEEVIARVGNEIITRKDVEREEARLKSQLSRRYQGDELTQQYEQQRAGLLDFMINEKLLEQKAKELDISVDDEITAAIKRLREENQIPDDAALESALAKEGTTLSELREDFRRRIIQQRILWNYVQGKVNINEDEIKNYYEQHKNEMMTPTVVTVKRFQISDDEIEKSLLNSEAKSLWNVLTTSKEVKKEDFPHMKMDENIQLQTDELSSDLVKLLEGTPVGNYTEPFEVSTGWVIFKIDQRTDGQPVPLEEARGQIYNLLLQQRSEKYQKSFLDDLRKQNYVEILKTT